MPSNARSTCAESLAVPQEGDHSQAHARKNHMYKRGRPRAHLEDSDTTNAPARAHDKNRASYPVGIRSPDETARHNEAASYNTSVRRFVLTFIVGLLTLSASGASSLIVDEPCTGFEAAGQGADDGACPPTCVTCGCCAQAVDAVAFAIASSPDRPVSDLLAVLPDVLNADPRDILHVPKLFLG